MQFSLNLSAEPVEQITALAQAAEQAGFSAISIPDSICYPREADSKYPYNADGSRNFLEDQPFIDPLVQATHIAAVTKSIRIITCVYKLPVRQPVLVAKMVSSVAALSNNRFDFGVGISPWQEDFAATGVPWAKRGQRLDECITILRGLLGGEYFSYHSELFDIPEIKLCPVPSQAVPILLGGHADVALRRTARCADGWIAATGKIDELSPMIARLHELRKEHQRDQLPFRIHCTGAEAFTTEGVSRLEGIGVDQVYLGFHNIYGGKKDERSLQQKIDQINGYADAIISKVAGQ
jgi:probable F420-dependent oxidoreductase